MGRKVVSNPKCRRQCNWCRKALAPGQLSYCAGCREGQQVLERAHADDREPAPADDSPGIRVYSTRGLGLRVPND